ncbi:MAG TPA: hypothetical protein VM118_15160 [Acidobacteriota bacterium]|nr:hypothetical protein [Acidobacteriota bacterium]
MKTLRTIYEIARADFRERIRRFSFAMTLVFAVFAAYAFVPPNHANYGTLILENYRGVYNSAWVGAQVAILASAYMILVGFYLVRNGINRDRDTGVGQIIAGTPMTRPVYTLGKWLSNCAVLTVIVGVLIVGAAALQLIRGEDTTLRPLQIAAPFLYLLIPLLAVVSALAVFFECVPFLRGAVGNVVYFFIVPQTVLPEVMGGPKIMGITYIIDHMKVVCRTAFPEYVNGMSVGFNLHEDGRPFDLLTFTWEGMPVTTELLLIRSAWILVALAIVFVAAIPFERFDTARLQKGRRGAARKPRFQRLRGLFRKAAVKPVEADKSLLATHTRTAPVHLTPIGGGRTRIRLAGILSANLRLALKSMPWWWHLGALGIIVTEIVLPGDIVHRFILPAAWIWPIAIWSQLGNREIRHATHQLIFSAAHPLRRQVPAAWLVGVLAALCLAGGAGARWIITGDWPRLLALFVGAAFVPSFALALGAWSRSSRLFEVLYLFWWYIGPFNGIAPLDYAGSSVAGGTLAVTAAYAVAALGFLLLGFLGARRQLQV